MYYALLDSILTSPLEGAEDMAHVEGSGVQRFPSASPVYLDGHPPCSSTELFWHTGGEQGARVSVQASLAPALLMLLMVSLFFKALRYQINQNNGDDARD